MKERIEHQNPPKKPILLETSGVFSQPSRFATLADEFRKKGQVQKALELCKEGLRESPDFTTGILVRALCFFDLKRYRDCLRETQKILEKDPENVEAEKLRAEVFIHLGQRKAAMNSLAKVANLVSKRSRHAQSMENESISRLDDFQVETLPGALESNALEKENFPINNVYFNGPQSKFEDTTFATRTVAELYLRQGLEQKAHKILCLMLQKDPSDAWAKENILKLEALDTKYERKARLVLTAKAQYLKKLLKQLKQGQFR